MRRFFLFLVVFIGLISVSPLTANSWESYFAVSASQELSIEVTGSSIIVKNLAVDTPIEIYNIMGTKVAVVNAKAGDGEYSINLARGYYIVKVGNIVKKVVLK